MNYSLLEMYCDSHSEFLNSLEMFSSLTIKKKFLKKLKKEKDRNNFCAIIAEIQFGKLFSKLGFHIEYDKVFPNNQTPDWTLKTDNSEAICEIYRLGKSEKDQKRSDFENLLFEELQKLRYNYCLEINFTEEYFNTTVCDIDMVVRKVENWFLNQKKK